MFWFNLDLEPYKIYLKKEIEEVVIIIPGLGSIKKDGEPKSFLYIH